MKIFQKFEKIFFKIQVIKVIKNKKMRNIKKVKMIKINNKKIKKNNE